MGNAFGGQIQNHGFAHHRFERQLFDRRFIAEKMMRRVDVRAGVHGHLNDVGDKTFVLPLDDRFQFEIFFIGRKGRRVAFFHRHAEIDDTHVKYPPRRLVNHLSRPARKKSTP